MQIIPTTKNIKSALESELGGAGTSAGKSAGSKICGLIKGAIAAAGIGAALKSAVSEGMELEQNIGGTEAVFASFAKNIQTSASDAYKNMGMSASEYMATANKMGSLFQGSGLAQQRALDLTSKAMQRAADVASVMGLDTAAAMESIAGAAKGNFTMMDNLGVAMNATTIQAYALEKGINFDWKTADNAQKAEVAMQMFFERTKQYEGNFARESAETLSGSMGAVKSALKNVLGDLALGNDLKQSLTGLSESAVALIKGNLFPMISNIVKAVPSALSTALPALAPEVIAAVTDLISDFASSLTFPQLIDAGFGIVSALVLGISESLPRLTESAATIVLHIVDSLVSGIPSLITAGFSLLSGIVSAVPMLIPVLIDCVPEIINSLIYGLINGLPEITSGALELLSGILDAIPVIAENLTEGLPLIITTIIDACLDAVPELLDAAITLFFAIMDAIPILLEALIPILPEIILSILSELIKATPKVQATAIDLFFKIIEAALDLGKKIPSHIKNIVTAIKDGLTEGISSVKNIGENLMEGLWNGILDKKDWVVGRIKGLGSTILSTFKEIFGIHSPATTTEWMGEMLDEGLARGVNKNQNPIRRAVDSVTKMTTGTLESKLAVNAELGITSSSEATDRLGKLIAVVSALSDKIDKLKIVLDSGKVVGGISQQMDEQLGYNNTLSKRGVAQ